VKGEENKLFGSNEIPKNTLDHSSYNFVRYSVRKATEISHKTPSNVNKYK